MVDNSFWHFGDSFAFNNFHSDLNSQPTNFGSIISKKLKLDYRFNACMGSSNELIFSSILTHINEFKQNDIIFVNWSFLSRSCYVDNFEIKSTNKLYDDNNSILNDYIKSSETTYFFNNHSFLMDYILGCNFDITYKLFKLYVQPLFDALERNNIKIYNLFIRKNDILKYNQDDVNWDVPLNNLINFDENYFDWLVSKKYMNQQEGHYSSNIQEKLATEIMIRMNLNKTNII